MTPALGADADAHAKAGIGHGGTKKTATAPIGIVSAFGAEADLLLAETRGKRVRTVNGNRFTSGVLRGQPVVVVLSGVGMVNAAMTTQLLIDRFRVGRLIVSGIAGGGDPARQVGDVVVPERWVMPLEVYWHRDAGPPAPCGSPGELDCLGLSLARGDEGRPLPPFALAAPQGGSAEVPAGLYLRETFVRSADAPQGRFSLGFAADARMLAVARSLAPKLERCGPRGAPVPAAAGSASASAPAAHAPPSASAPAPTSASAQRTPASVSPSEDAPPNCVRARPRLVVGGTGASGPAFVANPQYRDYLHRTLQVQTIDMETAAVAQVAHANGVPFLAFRSVSDLAGAEAADGDARTLFASGLAESNEAAVTLAFLDAWGRAGGRPSRPAASRR